MAPAAVSIACHNRIEFYLFESNILSGDFYRGNAADPPACVKPPWDIKIESFPLESTPHRLGGDFEKPPELYRTLDISSV